MKAYILSIAGIVLLTALITIVAPGGKVGKFLKGVTKPVILLVMLAPLATLFTGNGTELSAADLPEDKDYLAFCAEELAASDEAAIGRYLQETYGICAQVDVSRSAEAGFPCKKISVNITDFGIIGQDEHIHISEEVVRVLEERYGCEAEVT